MTKPTLAVISCGEGNTYGHPHKETLRLLKKAKVLSKRTDEEGTITITSDGERWQHVEARAGEVKGSELVLVGE